VTTCTLTSKISYRPLRLAVRCVKYITALMIEEDRAGAGAAALTGVREALLADAIPDKRCRVGVPARDRLLVGNREQGTVQGH